MAMTTQKTILKVLATPIIILFLLLPSGCGKKTDPQAGRGGGSGGGKTAVEAQIVHTQLLRNTISTTGTLLANEEVELRPEVSGRVTGIFFEEGKRVKRGEVLLKIDDSELKAQLKRKDVEEKQAADKESRQKKLREINVVSQEDYDRDLNAVHMVQAEKEALQAQLAKTEIKAPFDGVIGLRNVSEGGYISPNTLISTLQDTDPMKVEFSVPEKYASQLKNGTAITVRVGEARQAYPGAVYALESKIDPDTRTIKARAIIPHPGTGLIPGSFAKVEITLDELPDAIVVPSGAVVPRINDEIVYVYGGGKVRIVPVTTGIRSDSNVQITQGLMPGDTLIVSGLMQLADGKAVEITSLGTQ
jgi:membrane fusion protein (multidrug efflux system)